jgi:DUF1365 family protein
MAQGRFHLNEVKLAWGLVKHHRDLPKPNGFTTGACFVRLVFSINADQKPKHVYPVIDGKGLVSVSARNYGFEPHSQQFPEFVAELHARMEVETGEKLGGQVHLHTFPKVLGYVFNPVSFWYFHNEAQQCRVILCEVNNTFGERHFYLLNAPDSEGPIEQRHAAARQKRISRVAIFPGVWAL